VISILHGHVRIAMASDWQGARELLRAHVTALHWSHPRTERGDEVYAEQLARIEGNPDMGYLLVSGSEAWASTRIFAMAGTYGVSAGDLCFVRDYRNGTQWWTINVKAKLLSTSATEAVVRITGESLQFQRYEVRSIPLAYIARRKVT